MENVKALPNRRLWLIEYYTNHGQDIAFAWVYAADSVKAAQKLKDRIGKRFYEVITNNEQAEVCKLHLSKGKFPIFVD